MRKSGRPRKHDDTTANTVVDMYQNGEPIKEICRKTDVPPSTVYHILARHGLSARRTPTHNHSDIGFSLHDIHTEQEQIMHYLLIDNERLTRMLLDMGVYTGTATSKAVPPRTQQASSVQAVDKEGN
jgi:transposase-like protein